jgi:MOSC domain-containing protein YiiM
MTHTKRQVSSILVNRKAGRSSMRNGLGTGNATVFGVFASSRHTFSKHEREALTLLQGLGIEGDAHCGHTVKHVWDMKRDPTRPNLRQVHLVQSELFDELNAEGFDVRPGDLGENITTRKLDLRELAEGALLRIGDSAVVKITGLRTPCVQIERLRKGLRQAITEHRQRSPAMKAGIMGIVITGGRVCRNDPIVVIMPEGEPNPLKPV